MLDQVRLALQRPGRQGRLVTGAEKETLDTNIFPVPFACEQMIMQRHSEQISNLPWAEQILQGFILIYAAISQV